MCGCLCVLSLCVCLRKMGVVKLTANDFHIRLIEVTLKITFAFCNNQWRNKNWLMKYQKCHYKIELLQTIFIEILYNNLISMAITRFLELVIYCSWLRFYIMSYFNAARSLFLCFSARPLPNLTKSGACTPLKMLVIVAYPNHCCKQKSSLLCWQQQNEEMNIALFFYHVFFFFVYLNKG